MGNRMSDIRLTGKELFFKDHEIIVSKTDLKGRIIYANNTFAELAEITRKEAIGKPHSFIRHPHMPRCIFKLLWDEISTGKEVFAYVLNRSSKGNEYWVLAHVTPSYDTAGKLVGYHSNRRVPDRKILKNTIIPLYKNLLEIEQSAGSKKSGLENSFAELSQVISNSSKEYNHFILSLGN